MLENIKLSDYYDQLLNRLNCSFSKHNSEMDLLKLFTGKRILITGAAGSIGSEISKKIISYNPISLGLLDINESELHNLKLELDELSQSQSNLFLCDVSRKDSLKKIFSEFKPELVFHVAAYKHVHILEKFPKEALRINVLGTYNAASLSQEFNVTKFIFISTDKAVNPISKMGQSKRLAEIIIHKLSKNYNTDFVIVRLCNVIGSRGSVSEIFIKQILNGGPITLTHPDMRRYFITLSQAANFALKAAEFGENGFLFIPKIDSSIKITELLNELINKFNPLSESKLEILITGCREGERLDEELLTADELNFMTPVNGFLRIDPSKIKIDYSNCLDELINISDNEYSFIKNQILN